MSVKLFTSAGIEIPVKFWSFPGGERGCRIEENIMPYLIDVDFRGSDDLIDMLMLNDACRVLTVNQPLRARIRYMPYARQDRVSATGEAHSLRVAANIINSCNFDAVEIWDPHSDVTEALIKNAIFRRQEDLFHWLAAPNISRDAVLLAPDAGALKKIFKCADGKYDVYCAQKTRDARTGKLSGCYIAQEDLAMMDGCEIWIVDDICDGGGTFIQLIDYMKGRMAGDLNVNLFVTHGIFSKGKGVLYDAGFSQVVAANDWAA